MSSRSRATSERQVTPSALCDSLCGARPSFLWILYPLLFFHSACGQNDTFEIVSSTNQPVQCAAYWFFWIGGTPPYVMQVGPIDDTQHIDATFGIQATSWLWEPVDLLAGTHLVLMLTDSTGRRTIDTSWAVVQPGDDDSCLPEEEQGRSSAESSTAHSTSVSSSTAPSSTSSTPPPTTTSSSTTTLKSTRRASTSAASPAITSSRPTPSSHLLPTDAVANSTSLSFSTSTSSSPQSSHNTSQSPSSITASLPLASPSVASDAATGQKSMGSGAIAGIAVGAAVALLLALAALLWCHKWRRRVSDPALQRPEDLSDVDPFSAFPTAPSPSAKRAMSPFMYSRSSSAMSPFRAASPSVTTPTPSVLLVRDHAGSSTYPQDGSMQAAYPSEFSPCAAYGTQPNISDTVLPRPLMVKTSMAELSARSGSATALLSDQTPRSAVFPGRYDRTGQDVEDASDDAGTRVTATDGGVRLAGGPPGEAPQAVPARNGEMFPPPYHRY
ncbi:hypothetical protein OH76DRAFT_1480852 [Lentinus brumalis]|uniref:Mid2 domain-containing protein n=1 Tax=Lentinus brumalis TaxID=2498619 RepID=A0A371DIA3_9APHY|nr:hypothetical protein OH76DRAFT_1480852 [Polyporus brumalis]